MVLYIPLAVMLIGVFVFALTNNGKVSEIARAMFWCGLLVVLMHAGAKKFF